MLLYAIFTIDRSSAFMPNQANGNGPGKQLAAIKTGKLQFILVGHTIPLFL